MIRVLREVLAATGLLVGLMIFGVGCSMCMATPKDVLTVDDLLHAERLSDIGFSPNGTLVMFARNLPVTDRSTRDLVDSSLTDDRLFVIDSAGRHAQEIVPPTDTVLSPVIVGDPWAPDSRGALVFAASNGEYRLAYWDADTFSVTLLPGRLSHPWSWWRKDLIYFSSQGEGQQQPSSTVQLLKSIERRWKGAWTGRDPHVTVSSANPLVRPTLPAPGALMQFDVRTGIGKTIAIGEYNALIPSPGGRWMAAIRLAEDIDEAMSSRGRRGELQVFERDGDEVVMAWSIDDLDLEGRGNFDRGMPGVVWSRSGDRLLVGGKPAGEPRTHARIYEVEVKTGARREISGQGLAFIDPRLFSGGGFFGLGWIGDLPAMIGSRIDHESKSDQRFSIVRGRDHGELRGARSDLYIFRNGTLESLTSFAAASVDRFIAVPERGTALIVANGALWEVGTDAIPRRLTSADLGIVLDFATNPGGNSSVVSAYYRSASGAVERVALRVRLAGRDAVKRVVHDLATGKTFLQDTTGPVVASSRDLLTTVSRVTDQWAERYILQNDKGNEHEFAAINVKLNAREVAPATRFDYSVDGRDLIGWVVTPPNAKKSKPLPALMWVYGGMVYGGEPPRTTVVTSPVFSAQLFASQGYAVIYPSLPIQAGADTDIMATMGEQAVAAVDALAAKGIVDPQRVGIIGQSFGGYSTAAILTKRSDRFKAGISMAGFYDLIAGYGMKSLPETLTDDGQVHMRNMRWWENSYLRLGKPFWEDIAPYSRNSPIFHVDRLDTPLLILHGDLDKAATNFPGAERMYHALVRAGKKPVLVRYWGEGHVARSEWAQRDQWRRAVAWFDAHLKK